MISFNSLQNPSALQVNSGLEQLGNQSGGNSQQPNVEASKKTPPGVTVTISFDGLQRLAAESAASDKTKLGKGFGNDAKESASPFVSKAEEEMRKDPVQLMIDNLKKRIEEVKEKLAKLEGDKSPAAAEQKKLLRDQLVQLSSQLQSLLEKQDQIRKQEERT